MIKVNLIGKIEKIESKYVSVLVQPESACGASCGSCGGCSAKDGRQIKIKNQNYKIGQWLRITINDNHALYALLISSGIILGLLFLGYYLANLLIQGQGETPGVLGGIVGIIVGSTIVKLLEPLWQKIHYEVETLD